MVNISWLRNEKGHRLAPAYGGRFTLAGNLSLRLRGTQRGGLNSRRWNRPQTRRLNPAGFSFPFAGRGSLLALPFKPMLLGGGRGGKSSAVRCEAVSSCRALRDKNSRSLPCGRDFASSFVSLASFAKRFSDGGFGFF